MSALDAALSLAAKGCHVFPIIRTPVGNKKPGVRRWQWLATTDPGLIRAWWARERFRDASVGIHPLGLLVVDVDGPRGEAGLRALRERYAVPETVKVVSGNTAEPSHYQLFYRLPDGLRAIPRPLASVDGFAEFPTIDIKGSGGQVVGPGSVHQTGGTYRWEREPANLTAEATPAPDWMVENLCGPEKYGPPSAPAPGSDDELVQVLLHRFPVTAAGQRHHRMRQAVLWLAGWDKPAEEITRLMTRWARYHQPVYAATYEEACAELLRCTRLTVAKMAAGGLDRFPDHQQRSAELPLPPAAERWLHGLVYGPSPAGQGQQSTTTWLCSNRPRFPALKPTSCPPCSRTSTTNAPPRGPPSTCG
jgi:hypothetical protein